jgi:uncharacterized repeat protein (TIGR03803 family)
MKSALPPDRLLPLLLLSLTFVNPAWAAPQFKVLHAFAGGTDGWSPNSILTLNQAGDIFGTTYNGGGTECGSSGCGVAFEFAPLNGHWRESLYNFSATLNGAQPDPYAALAVDPRSNVYGATYLGGDPTCNCGFIFELTRGPAGWTETTLHTFTGYPNEDGANISSGLFFDAAGNLYGSTFNGGATNEGTVFELTPGPGGTWNYSTIHQFGGYGDGISPYGPVTIDSAGNIYGTTQDGGTYGSGAVYKVSPSDGAWTESVLYNFTLDSGQYPEPSGVAVGANGNLYGVTLFGGEYSVGTIYELQPAIHGFWNRTILYTFTGGADGALPQGGLTIGSTGALYGSSYEGGSYGYGNVFEFQLTNGKWRESILHAFANGSDGERPAFGVTLDRSGNLYGSAYGGIHGDGVIFEITP